MAMPTDCSARCIDAISLRGYLAAMRNTKLAIVLGALSACKQPWEEKPQAQAPAEAISIGATLPLTGSESRIGGFYKEGYELAFAEWNKGGGVKVGQKMQPVKLTLLD